MTTALQDQAMPQDASGPISHDQVKVNPTVQPKGTGQTDLPMATETHPLDLQSPETQDLLNPEATKDVDHASLQDHQIAATVQDQVLDTVQIQQSVQLATIAASAPIVQQEISAVIPSADLETRLEILEETTSHVQTRESMTATGTRTAKTEFQETSLVTLVLLALATRTQTAKLSLRTRF
jgi:hypothetical protein